MRSFHVRRVITRERERERGQENMKRITSILIPRRCLAVHYYAINIFLDPVRHRSHISLRNWHQAGNGLERGRGPGIEGFDRTAGLGMREMKTLFVKLIWLDGRLIACGSSRLSVFTRYRDWRLRERNAMCQTRKRAHEGGLRSLMCRVFNYR